MGVFGLPPAAARCDGGVTSGSSSRKKLALDTAELG